VIIKPRAVEVRLLAPVAGAASTPAISGNAPDQSAQPGTKITLPWSARWCSTAFASTLHRMEQILR
jgi:hypothetical protein